MTLSEYVTHQAQRWAEDGRPVVTATITRIIGSSSQPLGSKMAITDNGEFAGFVSGGCVESDVRDQAAQVLADGLPRLLNYQKATDVFAVGLNCEGKIDVVLERMNITNSERRGTHVTAYRVTNEPEVEVRHSEVEKGSLPESVVAAADDSRADGSVRSVVEGEWTYLVEPPANAPILLIVSVSSVAYPLCRIGRSLGYQVVISDPRSEYLQSQQFDGARLLNVWPKDLPQHLELGARCSVVSLNHEPRFEDDLFRMLQDQPTVAYIGAIGKRRRQTEREERQAESGFDLSRLPQIHTPVGLDLGGKSAEDVALSILAEIQAVKHGRPGGRTEQARTTT